MRLLGLILLSVAAWAETYPGTSPLTREGDLALQMVQGIDAYLMRELQKTTPKPGSRERFRQIIGLKDARVSFTSPALITTVEQPSLLLRTPAGQEVHLVSWPALPGMDAEGVFVKPAQAPRRCLILLPDAGQEPEDLVSRVPPDTLALIPVLINRESTWSGNPRIRMTTQPHREFIYRMAYQAGRHIIGYEVQKTLAAVDWFTRSYPGVPVAVAGAGEGGLIALFSAVADERISEVTVSGYAGPSPEVWREPIYRNVWSLLPEFSAGNLERLIVPRKLIRQAETNALPGKSAPPAYASDRQRRQFQQMVDFTQKLIRDSDLSRARFFSKADLTSPTSWAATKPFYADYFDREILGHLDVSPGPPQAQTRQVYDTAAFAGYEVTIPVVGEVFAYGILLVPKNMKPGERRPLVVAQHGLEGRPDHLIQPADARQLATYQRYAARLAERGFIVYVPQNPYIHGEQFRVLSRKGNPVKKTLFSFIVAQHRKSLDWLETLAVVDKEKIAFYGLSYGGKTAVRVPPLEERYRVVICSGDFNEWIWKITSVEAPFSYMFTHEYEILEFDLADTFNYSEMTALIAPRPFMVERGHFDGVSSDEWVSYEYAKVRRLYAIFQLPENTTIEYFKGPHQIWGAGTFDFLHRHLHWP